MPKDFSSLKDSQFVELTKQLLFREHGFEMDLLGRGDLGTVLSQVDKGKVLVMAPILGRPSFQYVFIKEYVDSILHLIDEYRPKSVFLVFFTMLDKLQLNTLNKAMEQEDGPEWPEVRILQLDWIDQTLHKYPDLEKQYFPEESENPPIGTEIPTFNFDRDVLLPLEAYQGKIYAVGSTWDGDDLTLEFLEQRRWQNAKEDQVTENQVKTVQKGGVLVLKSSFARRNDKVSVFRVKAIGVVEENKGDGFHLTVNWLLRTNNIDIEGSLGSHRHTISQMNKEELKEVFHALPIDLMVELPNLFRRPIKLTPTLSYQHKLAKDMRPALGATLIAKELADQLERLKGEAPILVGLFGRWGRGKTFLFNQIWKQLKGRNKFYRVDFHAWKHQQTPASWGYLYEKIAEAFYDEPKYWFPKKWRTMRFNWKREDKWEFWMVLWMVVVGIGTVIFNSFISIKEILPTILTSLGVLALIPLYKGVSKVLHKHSGTAKKLYEKYTKRHSYIQLLGMQAEIQKELRDLLEFWLQEEKGIQKRVLLFVDDIDRCGEDRIIEVVDSLRVMLEDPEIAKRVIVVAAIDERILSRAIRVKYKKIIPQEEHDETLAILTREYLDKLFLMGVKLGELNGSERKEIFNVLTEDKVEIEQDDFTEAARDHIGEIMVEMGLGEEKEGISVSTPKQQNTPKEVPIFEISKEEYKLIHDKLDELEGITPRQIRILYIRYLLARDFLIRVNGWSNWEKDEVEVLLELLSFLQNKNLFRQSATEILKAGLDESLPAEVKQFIYQLDEQKQNQLYNVLEMVVPY